MSVASWQARFDRLYPNGALVEVADEPGDDDGYISTTPRLVVMDEVDGRPSVASTGLDLHDSMATLVGGPEPYGLALAWETRDGRSWLTRPIPEGAPIAEDVKALRERLPDLWLDSSDPRSQQHGIGASATP